MAPCGGVTTTRAAVALAAVALALCACTADALYGTDSPVISVDGKTLKTKLTIDGVYLVEFFAPWCGHCKMLKPEYEKVAKALKGAGPKVLAVDVDKDKAVGGQFDIKGFPTIKAITVNNGKIKDQIVYTGERTSNDLVNFAFKTAKSFAKSKIGAKDKPKPKDSKKGGDKEQAGSGFYGKTSVVELTDATFNDKVLKTSDGWFMEFYAPWCGHCKNLKPAYIKASDKMKGKVKFGAVNCDEADNKPLCSRYGVKGFPTLMFFGKDKTHPEKYAGARTAEAIIEHANANNPKVKIPKPVELTSQKVFEAMCTAAEEPMQLCFIAFLPPLLDTQAEGRNGYIKVLEDLGKANAGQPYSYMWVEAGAQPDLESNFEVGGYGFPALVAFSPKKDAFVAHKGSFAVTSAKEMVTGLKTGRHKVAAIRGALAPIAKTAMWDGKDAPVIEEEEFSLDEIMGGGDETDGKAEL